MSLDLGGREGEEAHISQNYSFIMNQILYSEFCHNEVLV